MRTIFERVLEHQPPPKVILKTLAGTAAALAKELWQAGSDSEPEAHVMEPLADDHSSDSDDAPTGVEDSAAPATPAVARCSKESSHESA